ncbi:hypothetical protein KVR01_012310 [Diaporthe batatas]|uniref:uncharacterized protein n=1 Tax=Diaporthe batatas TaxID=748121 RepID=UPI001D0402B4|nr:uncharacterized protein KVR01_012310 [Diaporthe batatas]KAG8158038.1 hypothetical protein KVR01_012310 [Diaporthe batatas]
MGLVYQAAQRVIIWLGASNKDIDELFHWMIALDQQMLPVAKPHTITKWEIQWELALWTLPGRTLPEDISGAFAELLERDWFSRIWVLQEAALAKSAMIKCGLKEINSRTFVVMPLLLKIRCPHGVQARLDIMPGLLRAESWWGERSGRDLLTLLRKFGGSKATEPRDIVYALLGLSADAHSSELLRPDYEISTELVIQRVIAYFLVQQGKLSKGHPPQTLPKWTMDKFLDVLDCLDDEVFIWEQNEGLDTRLINDLRIRRQAEENPDTYQCIIINAPCRRRDYSSSTSTPEMYLPNVYYYT